jgi:superfamily II DNA or RNA helicase
VALRPCYLPDKFRIDCSIEGNVIRQLRFPSTTQEAEIVPFSRGKLKGELITLGERTVMTFPKRITEGNVIDREVLITRDGRASQSENSTDRWLLSSSDCILAYDRDRLNTETAAVISSWANQFRFVEEEKLGNEMSKPGLRPPQSGGLHAAIAHWKMSEEIATIVMPTGTGKTETMVALTLHERPDRLLVIVPSDALRSQISQKFATLGLLRQLGVCNEGALYPIVGVIRRQFSSSDRLRDFIEASNIVVSTMSLLSQMSDLEQELCARSFSHLFIDEAHHIKARTWERYRERFKSKRILQFTATPFRNDGAHVDGRLLFNYPLLRAQSEGYFQQINLLPLTVFDPELADRQIAEAAIDQLRKDIGSGFDHIVLARTSTITKAEALHKIYEELGAEYSPVLIHSELSAQRKRSLLDQLKARSSRVVVCVDMFGEGFDFPELKIAALHSIHKSLAITLQFTGRFTRTKSTIGDATIVVNTYDPAVDDALLELYAEDADWNQILRRLSEHATGKQAAKQEFIDSFQSEPRGIPIQTLAPKMSTVVYETQCTSWKPQRILDTIPRDKFVGSPSINPAKNICYFVLREEDEVEWGRIKEFVNRSYDLFVLYWDQQRRLLFINTSNNEAPHEILAKAVAGDSVELVKGSKVFRVFGNLNRLLLQTLGLSHTVSRVIRFTMHVGLDIPAGLADAQTHNKIKTNVFGSGFSDAERITIGCSRKGRIWSRQVAPDLHAWIEWCNQVGAKLQNRSFSEDDILKHSIIPTEIEERPALMPLSIEWPDSFYLRNEDATAIYFEDEKFDFDRVGLEIANADLTSPVYFRIFSTESSTTYKIEYSREGASYVRVEGPQVSIGVGRRKKSLPDWFRLEPPIIRFENDAFTKDNQLCRPYEVRIVPFESSRMEAWDWTLIDLKVESQTTAKLPNSIQYRVIDTLKSPRWREKYDVVFDDDGSNEAADVIALRIDGDRLLLRFIHCKYSSSPDPGARIEDLYAVCGQAQRSVQWRAHLDHLFSHLIKRDVDQYKRVGVGRFEIGDRKSLLKIRRLAPYLSIDCEVYIVQPGVSKSMVSQKQLELLGATELYLIEQFQMRLCVITSA